MAQHRSDLLGLVAAVHIELVADFVTEIHNPTDSIAFEVDYSAVTPEDVRSEASCRRQIKVAGEECGESLVF
jgi:hypothetical protein